MKLKINVTEEHIRKGVMANPESCAIALAVRELFPGAEVNEDEIYFDEEKAGVPSRLPTEAQDFIAAFDVDKKVDPIEFEVEVPDEVIASIGNMDEVKELVTKTSSLELVEA